MDGEMFFITANSAGFYVNRFILRTLVEYRLVEIKSGIKMARYG